MASIAKITLVGNLGRDPETRYTPGGTMNVTFSMAVSRRFRDQSGQDQERTTWFRVTCWGKLAEVADRLSQSGALVKGKQVYVDGRIESREYQDPQGQTRTSLDVTANELQLLGSRTDGDQGYSGERSYGGQSQGGGYGGNRGGRGGGEVDQNNGPDNYDEVPF